MLFVLLTYRNIVSVAQPTALKLTHLLTYQEGSAVKKLTGL